MSDHDLAPLPDDVRALLDGTEKPPMPGGFDAKVMARLQGTLAAGGLGAGAGAGAAAGVGTAVVGAKLGALGVPLAIAALAIGGAGGVVAGRTVLAPPPERVVEIREVRVEVPVFVDAGVTEVVVAPPPVPTPSPSPKPEKPVRDVALAEERALVEQGRASLARGDLFRALEAVESHAKRYPRGQLEEEREALWVQALLASGDRAAAKKKAAAFKARFPESMLWPVVAPGLE